MFLFSSFHEATGKCAMTRVARVAFPLRGNARWREAWERKRVGDESTGFRVRRCESGPRGTACGRPAHHCTSLPS